MLQMWILHFFSFFVFSISCHNVHKNKDEGIACNGSIMLWWNLNDNGPRFSNTTWYICIFIKVKESKNSKNNISSF